MLNALLHATGELGPVATSVTVVFSATVVVILAYVGIAMRAVLRAPDAATKEIYYRMFRDLLNVVRPWKSP